MADYYPLIAKAIDRLSESSAEARSSVYERARAALVTQLGTLDPPLPEAEIERERRDLEAAIARVERERRQAQFAAEPARPPPPAAAPEPPPAAAPESPPPSPRPMPVGRRIDQPALKRGGRRGQPLVLLGSLTALAVPIAILAWLWRDQPASTIPDAAPPAPPPVAVEAPKFGERVSGRVVDAAPPQPAAPPPSAAVSRPAPTPAPTPAPATSPVAPAPPAQTVRPVEAPRPPAQPDLNVAQRAILLEENQADPQQPAIATGRALWRLDALNAGRGQTLETVVRGTVEMPEAGLNLNLLVRKNTDPALPASHTIELAFSSTGDRPRAVRDIGLPQLRQDETTRGIPLAGLPVPVKENLFLVGLSDLKSDTDRNTELLLRRSWIEIPIRFAAGQKAALLVEKGVSGDRVFTEAFRQWGGGS